MCYCKEVCILYYIVVLSNVDYWNTILILDFSSKYYIEDFKLTRNDEFKIRETLFKHSVASTLTITIRDLLE